MQRDDVVARHIDQTAVVQHGVKHGDSVVFRHVDLVKDAEAAVGSGLRHWPLAQTHFAADKGVGSDEGAGVGVDVEGDGILRPAEQPGQIVRQNVLAGCLAAAQQQVFPLQQGRRRQLQRLLADKVNHGFYDSRLHRRIHRIIPSELLKARFV